MNRRVFLKPILVFFFLFLEFIIIQSLISATPATILTWQKTFGGKLEDFANSIQQTTDGGYIIAGGTASFGAGSLDVYVLKLNADGELQWQETFGGNGTDIATSIQQTFDGGYIVAGYMLYEFGLAHMFILKLDAEGNLTWQKTFSGMEADRAYSIQQTTDGGYIIAGNTKSFEERGKDVCVLKLDESGNLMWQKTFGGKEDDVARSIQQIADGGYIVSGYTKSFGSGKEDVYVLKLDIDGNLIWGKTFGGSNVDRAYSVEQIQDGGYIIAGYTQSFGTGSLDVYILKLNADGELQWQRTLGGSDIDRAYSVKQTQDGGYIVIGETYSFGAGKSDVYVIKTDAYGNTGPEPESPQI